MKKVNSLKTKYKPKPISPSSSSSDSSFFSSLAGAWVSATGAAATAAEAGAAELADSTRDFTSITARALENSAEKVLIHF